jgi:hypothetical protein
LYKKLITMADLTQPLHKSVCSEGCDVDISPSHGCLGLLSSLATHATVLKDRPHWDPPARLGFRTKQVQLSNANALVRITKVFAPNVTIKGLKNSLGKQATLGDFILDSFEVVLPMTMLRARCDKRIELSAIAGGGGELLEPVEINQCLLTTPVQSNKGGGVNSGTLDFDNIDDDDDTHDEIQGIVRPPSEDDNIDILDNLTSTVMLEQIDKVLVQDEPWNAIVRPHWPFCAGKDGVYLNDPPDHVIDKFRAVQADAFHVLHRIYVSTKLHYATGAAV